MATSIIMTHTASGMYKNGYYGFSWTYLLFGPFVPLIRGEILIACLHLAFTLLTSGLWQLVYAFFYNKHYMRRQLAEGWVLDDIGTNNRIAAQQLGVILKEPKIG